MPAFTIKTSMESGKQDDQWGPEYMVKLEESPETFKINFKEPPKDGDVVYGTIEQGKWGPWFKRGKKENADGTPAKPFVKKSPFSPAAQAEKNDGMRQGMCINNASEYIRTLEPTVKLTPRDWAEAVYSYACALYSKGDLKNVENISAPVEEGEKFDDIQDAPTNVKDLFAQ